MFGLGVERGLVVETVKDATEEGGPAEDLYSKSSQTLEVDFSQMNCMRTTWKVGLTLTPCETMTIESHLSETRKEISKDIKSRKKVRARYQKASRAGI